MSSHKKIKKASKTQAAPVTIPVEAEVTTLTPASEEATPNGQVIELSIQSCTTEDAFGKFDTFRLSIREDITVTLPQGVTDHDILVFLRHAYMARGLQFPRPVLGEAEHPEEGQTVEASSVIITPDHTIVTP